MLYFVKTNECSWVNTTKGPAMAIELWVDGREYQASSTRTLPVEDPATGAVVDVPPGADCVEDDGEVVSAMEWS